MVWHSSSKLLCPALYIYIPVMVNVNLNVPLAGAKAKPIQHWKFKLQTITTLLHGCKARAVSSLLHKLRHMLVLAHSPSRVHGAHQHC